MATQVSDTGSKTKTRGSSSDELGVIAQRAQAFTNASGTAIALKEGSGDEIVCRARSGSSAPDVGTTLRVEGSFTGLCIQSGKELRCDDAETDTRVDTAAIRALGIRSMVVTPIKDENRVVGVLAVFAPTAHAFTITHVAVLKTMADQISASLQKERRAGEEGHAPEAVRPVATPAVPRPVPAGVGATVSSPVLVKPAAPAPAVTPRAVYPVVSKVEPIRTTLVVEPLAAPATFPKREEKRAEQKADRANFGTFDAVAAEGKKPGSRLVLLAAAVVVIAAAATFAFLKMRRPAPPAATPHVQEVPAPGATAQPAPPGSVTATTSQPAAPAEAGSLAPTSPAPAASGSSTTAKPAESNNGKKPEKNSEKNNASKHEAETVVVSTGGSKIAPAADSGQNSEAAPTLALGGAPGNLNALASPGATSTPAMLTQSTLEPIQVIKKVPPIYPPIAKQRMISGTVNIQGLVGTDGKVSNLQFLSGPPIFREAAFEAVKQWVFKPARLNGQAIEQTTQIQLNFKP